MDVETALLGRKSVRAYRAQPVPLEAVKAVLDVARHAPSGGNLQPWRMIVVSGDAKQNVTRLAQQVLAVNPRGEEGDYPIYPNPVRETYKARRNQVGEDMYAILGIAREDKAARMMQMAQNFEFFGAPVAIFFVIDKAMGHGQWAHMGMLMQSICLAAHAQGLATCMQEAWAMVRASLASHFELEDHEMVYCGLALGYEDTDAPINRLRTQRAALNEIAVFHGF
ncbi:MAG: hypothetical protein RL186_761 [Pseudomonadota bacterium]|jgi:nitroreductase